MTDTFLDAAHPAKLLLIAFMLSVFVETFSSIISSRNTAEERMERRHEESTTQRRARSHSRHQVRRSSQRTSTRTDRDTTPRPSYASAASTPARRLNTDIAEGNRGRDASARDRGRPHCAHDTVEVLQDKNPSDSRLERALAEHQREAVAERADILFVNHHLHTENENLRDEKHQLAAALNSAEARIRDAEVQHAQTRQLLDARTQELFAMQSVFGPPSALSERDIVRSVEELNEEIFQLSALMADSLVRVAGDQTKVAQAMKTMVQRLGEPVCTALTNDDDAMRLAAVQLTLQATAAFWCGSVVERWALSSSTLERGMRRLYAEISEKEPQAVAARWKAVARKNMQDAEDATDGGMRERLCEMLQDVLDAAGYAIEDEHGERGVALGEGVATVLRLSVGLRSNISTIVSAELLTVLPRGGKRYDSASMEAEDATGRPDDAEVVACGITLGLVRVQDLSKKHTLVRPKVVLVSSFAPHASASRV